MDFGLPSCEYSNGFNTILANIKIIFGASLRFRSRISYITSEQIYLHSADYRRSGCVLAHILHSDTVKLFRCPDERVETAEVVAFLQSSDALIIMLYKIQAKRYNTPDIRGQKTLRIPRNFCSSKKRNNVSHSGPTKHACTTVAAQLPAD